MRTCTVDAQLISVDAQMLCQTVPDYAAIPGWFVAPEDCEEIETDLEIGGKKIQRMMVTQAAEPEKGAAVVPSCTDLYQNLKALLMSCELPAGSSDLTGCKIAAR